MFVFLSFSFRSNGNMKCVIHENLKFSKRIASQGLEDDYTIRISFMKYTKQSGSRLNGKHEITTWMENREREIFSMASMKYKKRSELHSTQTRYCYYI